MDCKARFTLDGSFESISADTLVVGVVGVSSAGRVIVGCSAILAVGSWDFTTLFRNGDLLTAGWLVLVGVEAEKGLGDIVANNGAGRD